MAAPRQDWTFERFRFGTAQEAGERMDRYGFPISDRYLFNPQPRVPRSSKQLGFHGDVGGREYQKWLEY